MKHFINFLSLFSLTILLAGCAKHEVRTLPVLRKESALQSKTIDDVTVSYKTLNAVDSVSTLDQNVIKLGIQPVHISIENNSPDDVMFSLHDINQRYMNSYEVASKMHYSVAGRACGWGIPGLFLWPLLIPAVIDGCGASEANSLIDADVATKMIFDKMVPPSGLADGLVFVRGRVERPFIITLVNKKTNEKMKFEF